MIQITLKNNEIEITGHARAGPYGEDIVCAGISTLVETLIASLEHYEEDFSYKKQKGYATIKYKHVTEKGRVLMDSFFIGISGIAESYPDNVNILLGD